ncbi:MAG: aspartate--tRNA ligase [Planctomycetaceae bacterium]|nr:aspartate--tRNA ligase [Planctomycetaceae bacterium]
MLRTKTCGELRKEHNGQSVTLAGWVDTVRDHSGVLFINLRDRYGLTQIVFLQENDELLSETVRTLHPEDVVQITGTVGLRPEGIVNKKIPTGEIEVNADSLTVLNRTAVVPFQPSAPEVPAEETRLKYRYLDLRRPAMQKTLLLRHRITKVIRDYFDGLGFIEVETPMLGKSTPEGARDYLVPSRVAPGQFYALPQSPQIYKQILMIAGYDRYFQIARCFRDEDLRADRQPEFTQLDVEMSFINSEDIIEIISGLVVRLMKNVLGRELKLPIPRLGYDEAMERFGSDAPDLRFGMELIDLTDLAKEVEFRVFRSVADEGGRIRAINAKGAAEKYSRKDIDGLNAWVIDQFGAKGVAWLKVDADGKLTGPIAKNFTDAQLDALANRLGAKPNDFILFSADTFAMTCRVLNGLRRRLATELGLIDSNEMNFCWIVRFPMFDWDEEGGVDGKGRWIAMHHPFTAPLTGDVPYLDSEPGKARAKAYDLVLNGFEVGGGTVRIHDSEVQSKVFDLLGFTPESAKEQFGFLLEALQFGAPPHGGIALGLDRLVMLFGGLDNIRDCIAFPKTTKAADLMTGAPGTVAVKQLAELGIKIAEPEA